MDAEDFSAEALAKNLRETSDVMNEVGDSLTLKERFRRTMFFQEVAPIPNFEFGYWDRTLDAWHEQGMPEHVKDEESAYKFFGIENWTAVPVNLGLTSVCEHETLEETEEYIVYRDSLGIVAQINKNGDRSIPHYLDFPVKDCDSWMPYAEALNSDDDSRYTHVDDAVTRLRDSSLPVIIPGGSLVGVARNLIGFERIAMMSYEDPELFQEIVDTFGNCIVKGLERVLPRIQVDACMGWEDICFNQGPVISPHVFDAVVGPWYRKIADLLAAHGCVVYTTDTDGNIMPIVDTFMKNGLNTMFPVEVHAGTDPVLLREQYPHIRLWGGVDKMILINSKEAIDKELERIRPLVEKGGFIPGVDHRVPADVPYSLYLYYLDRKRKMFQTGGLPEY